MGLVGRTAKLAPSPAEYEESDDEGDHSSKDDQSSTTEIGDSVSDQSLCRTCAHAEKKLVT